MTRHGGYAVWVVGEVVVGSMSWMIKKSMNRCMNRCMNRRMSTVTGQNKCK